MSANLDAVQFGRAAVHACITLFINPLFYIGTLLLIWELLRNAKAERKFFGIRVTKLKSPLAAQVFLGLLAGVLASAALVSVGAVVTDREIAAITALSLLAGVLRVRFLAVSYAIGVLLALHAAAGLVQPPADPRLHAVWSFLSDFHSKSWLTVAAGVNLVQAALLWLRRNRGAAPVAVLGKRGGTMGAFVVQLAFLSVFVLPVTGHDVGGWRFPDWWPALESLAGGFTLSALPVFTGISVLFAAHRPQQGLLAVYRHHAVTGVTLAAIACLARFYNDGLGALAGAVVCIVLEEFFLWWLTRRELVGDPLFTETPLGVRILSTVRGSLAEQMGLLPGETITHVNQVPVHTAYDLHFALDQNPAYAKLQVLDLRGEARFVGKPVYEGERHQLGLIAAPNTSERCGYQWFKAGLFQSLYARVCAQGDRSVEQQADVAADRTVEAERV
jgi:hypothetical protein